MADEEILKIPIDASDLPPALKILEQISAVLQNIEKNVQPFDKLHLSVSKSNKELEKTSKHFDNIFNKIKLSKLASEAWGGIKTGAGIASFTLGGMIAGLVGMAVYGTSGATSQIEQSRRWGLRLDQFKALGLTSEKMGKAGMLEATMGNLTETMRDINRSGAFASLGLNQRALQRKDPVSAMFEVINAIKKSPLNNPANPLNFALLKSLAGQMGLNDPDLFLTAIKEGASRMQGIYAKDARRYSGLSAGQLERGEYALIDFRANMEKLTWKIGGAFSPALVGITDVLNSLVDKYGGKVSKFIQNTFTERNVEAWTKNIERFISAMGKVATWLEKHFGWMIDTEPDKKLTPQEKADKKIGMQPGGLIKKWEKGGSIGRDYFMGLFSGAFNKVEGSVMELLTGTPAEGSTIDELNKAVTPGSVLDALNQPASDNKGLTINGGVHLHFATPPTSAAETLRLVDSIKAATK